MSEIKGQLLGIILVLMVFGVIGAAIKTAFSDMKDTVVESVADINGKVSGIITTTSVGL